ncbi:MAG: SMC family ATPase [Gemmatimonadetes bacterium]|nr:SMC family ATPase [Gemmatimonadota bacterium]
MRLNRLAMTNFRQHAESVLVFDTGLTFVLGDNGTGKSTILEAIAWALYGQSAARGTRDSIRFVRAGPRATVRVELDFELGGHRYRVVRGLNSAELFQDGEATAIANSISTVNDQLVRKLGMTRTEFFHTYFTGQKELNVMSSMGPSERSQFLSRVLGYERLRVAQENVRERKRMVQSELIGLRGGMPDPELVTRGLNESGLRHVEAERLAGDAEAAWTAAARRVEELTPGWAAAQATRDRFLEVTAELRVIETQLNGLLADQERIDRDLDSTAHARGDLERLSLELAPMASFAAEYNRLEELNRAEGRRLALTDGVRVLTEELQERQGRRRQVADAGEREVTLSARLVEERARFEELVARLEQLRTDWVRDRQEAETKRDALRAQYTEIKKQRDRIVELGEDGACPTCTRVLGENFRTVLDQVDEQLDTITVDGRYYGTRLTQLEVMPPEVAQLEEERREMQRLLGELEGQLATARGDAQEVVALDREIEAKSQRLAAMQQELAGIPQGYDAARHVELRAEIDRLAPLNERATRLSTQLEREPELLAAREDVRRRGQELQERLAHLHTERDVMRFSEQDFVAARQAQEAAAQALQDAEVRRASAAAELKAAHRAVEGATAAMRELRRAQELEAGLLRDRKLHEQLDRAYTDLRTDLNHALRPELAQLAGEFLAELTDHRYSDLTMDDDYNVVVSEDGSPKPVISGGEEDLTNLALRLAISQMIAERSGQRLSLLVLDEIFGSLDQPRQLNVIGLLRRLQDQFEQVILMSHIESISDGAGDQRILRLSYDVKTGSSVVQDATDPLPDEGLFRGTALAGSGA